MFAALLARLVPFKRRIIVWAFIALLGVSIVQEARLKVAQATVAAKVESITALQELLSAQSAGIEAMAADTARREASAKVAVADAKKLQERARAQVANIQAAPVPADCSGAMQWLVTEGAKLEASQ